MVHISALRSIAKWSAATIAFAVVWWFIAIFIIATRLYAHEAPISVDAPLGWTYPFSCCSNQDCRPLTEAETKSIEKPEGFVIPGTGEVVPMTDRRVKPSPDGRYHWCAHQAGIDAGQTICLFVPPRGY